jgi:hypothetical protein
LSDDDHVREGFRTVSKVPAPGALSRARAWLLEAAPDALVSFDSWTSLACICDSGWLAPLRRPSNPYSAMARVARRRLRVLASRPLAYAAFTALRAGDGPVHLRGRCVASPGHGASPVWRTEEHDDPADGRLLIEEGHDFVLSIEGGDVYVLSSGGHLASAATLHAGDEVSVFGFADEIPDRWGLAPALHGRGGVLPAVRSGSELPLLLTRVVP